MEDDKPLAVTAIHVATPLWVTCTRRLCRLRHIACTQHFVVIANIYAPPALILLSGWMQLPVICQAYGCLVVGHATTDEKYRSDRNVIQPRYGPGAFCGVQTPCLAVS
ncbi:hypothetical protein PCH_Pc13g01740 [Penicillium rubens Wisconsin 54-1255]|uniref:Uncharacterized protein n=1 Tax=Penicillium rubens (strain ATCC 28089 / DSM 1075 / NRRL 1951 / Wisconsin 54-1255) TaxID=500485 RepID=B6H1T4_PENRW|nr:hypothetical protein PCH_Pc13g01740 [Penicillium rubens Wisconsin 54-1255]